MYANSIITHARLARKVGSFDVAAVYLAIARHEGWVRFNDIDWSFHPRSIKTVRSYVAMLEAMRLESSVGAFSCVLLRARNGSKTRLGAI